jgi:hypothetical protein
MIEHTHKKNSATFYTQANNIKYLIVRMSCESVVSVVCIAEWTDTETERGRERENPTVTLVKRDHRVRQLEACSLLE